nr:hypothetical protein [uncultured Campylobacter sp.]
MRVNFATHRKTAPKTAHAQKRSGERLFRPPFDPLRRQFISLFAKKNRLRLCDCV